MKYDGHKQNTEDNQQSKVVGGTIRIRMIPTAHSEAAEELHDCTKDVIRKDIEGGHKAGISEKEKLFETEFLRVFLPMLSDALAADADADEDNCPCCDACGNEGEPPVAVDVSTVIRKIRDACNSCNDASEMIMALLRDGGAAENFGKLMSTYAEVADTRDNLYELTLALKLLS